jgi:cell division septation protein DedD
VKSRAWLPETSSPTPDEKAETDTRGAKPDTPRALAVVGHRNQPSDSSTAAETNAAARWKENPQEHATVIQRGATVAEIANTNYGSNKLLGLDLIKEFNPQIENLNRVSAGQHLWLPPLSEETLVRRQTDGSYYVILGAFSRTGEAQQFAQQIRQKRHEVTVTPRKISENMSLYRVEVVRLKDRQAARQVWDTAQANQWVPLAANARSRGQSQRSLRAQPFKPLAAASPLFQPRPTPARLDSIRPASVSPSWASLPITDRR